VDFLESIHDATRQKEAEVRRETAEGLDQFRRKQEEAEQRALMGEDAAGDGGGLGGTVEGEEQVSWVPSLGRKRKKGKEEKEGVKGLKVRKTSSAAEDAPIPNITKSGSKMATASKPITPSTAGSAVENATPVLSKAPPEAAAPKPVAGLGLAGYSSDED